VGPSLAGRAAIDRRRLVEAILQPSKNVDPGYLPVTVVTTDGEVATGIFHKQDSNGARSIYDSEGKVRTFERKNIATLIPQKASLMPDGLVNTMTLQEIRDLLSYLQRPTEMGDAGAGESRGGRSRRAVQRPEGSQ
jgi:putative heme-binding domain-containing protein